MKTATRAVMGIGAAAGLGATAVVSYMAAPVSADSGIIYSGGGADCAGQWLSGPDQFRLMDRAGGSDDDYCYINYGGSSSVTRRLTIPEDSSIGQWQYLKPDLGGMSSVYLQVCEERENDPDLCSSVHGPYSL